MSSTPRKVTVETETISEETTSQLTQITNATVKVVRKAALPFALGGLIAVNLPIGLATTAVVVGGKVLVREVPRYVDEALADEAEAAEAEAVTTA